MMTVIEEIKAFALGALFGDFRYRNLSLDDLREGYKGYPLARLKEGSPGESIEFDLAIQELEKASHITTGPEVAYEDDGSGLVRIGVYSKYEYACLAEAGYKAALDIKTRRVSAPKSQNTTSEKHFFGIHPLIAEKCEPLYESAAYAEAVEKSFKVVRNRLRSLTGYETGSEAFGKGKLRVKGAAASHVDEDFNQAIKFLTMSIDMFRNEKAHTVDGNISDPIRAHQYLSLSSLALHLLENADVQDNQKTE